MDSLCVNRFINQWCKDEGCPYAHELHELRNVENWVTFDAPDLVMLDFLPYKYQSHPSFKYIMLPGKGPLVRFGSKEDALAVVDECRNHYNPQHLPDLLGRSPTGSAPQNKPRALRPVVPTRVIDTSSVEGARSPGCLSPGYLSPAGSFIGSPLGSYIPDSNDWDRIAVTRSIVRNLNTSDSSPDLLESPFSDSSPLSDSPFSESDCLSSEYASNDGAQFQQATAEDQQSVKSPTVPDKKRDTFVNNEKKAKHPGFVRARKSECDILQLLKEKKASADDTCFGWKALMTIWGVVEEDLDASVLDYLASKSTRQQEQILLAFAALDLSHIKNLSAYMNCLIREHESSYQVCLHFLGGLCDKQKGCQYNHPTETKGWNALRDRWGVTYDQMDYAVLSYLSKKSCAQQDEILVSFADMNLRNVKNLSAYLSSMIQKYESSGLKKRAKAKMNRSKMVGASKSVSSESISNFGDSASWSASKTGEANKKGLVRGTLPSKPQKKALGRKQRPSTSCEA